MPRYSVKLYEERVRLQAREDVLRVRAQVVELRSGQDLLLSSS